MKSFHGYLKYSHNNLGWNLSYTDCLLTAKMEYVSEVGGYKNICIHIFHRAKKLHILCCSFSLMVTADFTSGL